MVFSFVIGFGDMFLWVGDYFVVDGVDKIGLVLSCGFILDVWFE